MSGTTLDKWDSEITNSKIVDIEKKIAIAFNVFRKCQEYAKIGYRPRLFATPVGKCCDLTGVSAETLLKITHLQQNSKSFADWLTKQNEFKSVTINKCYYEYDRLKNILVEYYTKKLEIPESLDGASYKNNGFTLLTLPGTKHSIIVEKPETVLERHKFLCTKMKYRDEKRHIVYIGKINILMRSGVISYEEDDIPAKGRFLIAASPTLGHINHIYCCGFASEYITNWIEEKVIPKLPDECVIIFQENVPNNINEAIDSRSRKHQMINWLSTREINHDPEMHRADLYKLINTFKVSDRLSPTEETLKAHGHTVIRKKKCNLKVNYLDPFWALLLQEMNAKMIPEIRTNSTTNTSIIISAVNEIVMNVPSDFWENLEKALLEKEKEIYKEDLEMEEVIDKLLNMVKHEGLPREVKLGDYRKTMVQPPMYLNRSYVDISNLFKKSNC